MTTQQDKELSSEVALVAKYALEYIDALPKDIELPTMPGFDRDWADAVMDKLKRSPQLPVAEQPAGQAVPDDIHNAAMTVHARIDSLCNAANTAGADYFDASTSMLIATRDLLLALGKPHPMDFCRAAPHSPVAQMSGDLHNVVISHCEDLERSVPILREHRLGPVADEFKKAASELRAALASHPSNAVQDAPVFDADVSKRLRLLCRMIGLENAVPSDDETLMGCLFAVFGQMRSKVEALVAAATVPQVVQAPTPPEGWKIVHGIELADCPNCGSQVTIDVDRLEKKNG